MAKKKGTSLWDVIKTILGFIFNNKKKVIDKQKEEAIKIEENLKEEYSKIDEKKEEDKKENEDYDNAVDNLNDMF